MNENEQVIQDGTTADYLNNLVNDRDTMVTNLNTMGVPAEANETFTDLAQRILEIPQGDDIQYDTMPVPSIDYLDKIVQYVGETTLQEPIYTNGYFYKCISDGQDPATYSWENINVQTIPEYTIPLEVFDLTDSSSSADIITALGGNDNIVKLREAFKNNKEVTAIKKNSSTTFTTTIKYMYYNIANVNEIIKLEAVYTATNSTTDYKRHFIALTGSYETWSVSAVSVTDIATTELTGLLTNLQTADKTSLVNAINELVASGSPIQVVEDGIYNSSTYMYQYNESTVLSSLKGNGIYIVKDNGSKSNNIFKGRILALLICHYEDNWNEDTRQILIQLYNGIIKESSRLIKKSGTTSGNLNTFNIFFNLRDYPGFNYSKQQYLQHDSNGKVTWVDV